MKMMKHSEADRAQLASQEKQQAPISKPSSKSLVVAAERTSAVQVCPEANACTCFMDYARTAVCTSKAHPLKLLTGIDCDVAASHSFRTCIYSLRGCEVAPLSREEGTLCRSLESNLGLGISPLWCRVVL